MHKAAHQQVLAPVGSPKQFQAGDRWSFADFIAHAQPPLGRREMLRLVGEGEAVAIEPLLQFCQRAALPVDAEGGE